MKILHNIRFYKLLLISLVVIPLTSWQLSEPALKKLANEICSLNKKTDLPSGRNIYLILPNQGCEGCITSAEQYTQDNYNNPHIYYVFTRINSVKLLRLILTNKVFYSKHILLDTANKITYPDDNMKIYPMVAFGDKGKISRIEYQSPASDGLKDIDAYLSQSTIQKSSKL
jgi:hypothetical protein